MSKLRVSFDIYICSWLYLYCLSSYKTLAIVVINIVMLVIYESSFMCMLIKPWPECLFLLEIFLREVGIPIHE